jgi:6-pyruvoyltetrahydropterin/6-carboxytetrahydropterin synthase
MKQQQFHVRVAKDDHVFSAAHFLIMDGTHCEPLHGHNFRVAAEVAGPLDENQFVVDFLALCGAVKSAVATLDHAVLLPTESPDLSVTAGPREVEVAFHDRRWVFPLADCRLLPLASVTAELLARHLAMMIRNELHAAGAARLDRVRVEVEEAAGQTAVCEIVGSG